MAALLDAILRDLLRGLRSLGRSKTVTAVAVLSIGIGMAVPATVFSYLRAQWLQPFDVTEPDELVRIGCPNPTWLGVGQIRSDLHPLADILAFSFGESTLEAEGQRTKVRAEMVTDNYFDVLGVHPVRGRFFADSDAASADATAVVLSEALWKRRFDREGSILGRIIDLDGEPARVVGIASRRFGGAVELPPPTDVWMMCSSRSRAAHDSWRLWGLIARPRPSVSRDRVQAAVREWVRRSDSAALASSCPRHEVVLQPANVVRWGLSAIIGVITALATFILGMACVNVTGLLLAREEERRQQLAVRMALGAGRLRLIRERLAESFLLASAGCLVGLALARVVLHILRSMMGTPGSETVSTGLWLTPPVAALAALLTGLVVVDISVPPALSAWRQDLASLLRGRPAAARKSRLWGRRDFIIVSQLAAAFVFMAVAILAYRMMDAYTSATDMFFRDRDDVQVSFFSAGRTSEERRTTSAVTLSRASALPGVQRVAAAEMPIPGIGMTTTAYGNGVSLSVTINAVTPGYFPMTGIRLLQGRAFTEAEARSGQRMVVASASLTRKLWAGESPLGQLLRLHGDAAAFEVVGVCLDAPGRPTSSVYLPYTHARLGVMALLVQGGPSAVVGAGLRRILRTGGQTEADVPVWSLRETSRRFDPTARFTRGLAGLAGLLSFLSCALAAVGVFAMVSQQMARRRSEIGLRVAVGAHESQIATLVLRRTFALALLGSAVAAPVALAAAWGIASLPFLSGIAGVSASSGAIMAALLMALVALAAAYFPARRAARVDPMEALRCE